MASQNTEAAFYAATTQAALRDAFLKSIKDSNAVGRDGGNASHFERRLDREIRTLNRLIRQQRFSFSPYRMMLKSKGSAKSPREISIPIVRDRVLLKAMSKALHAAIPASKIERPQPKIAALTSALETDEFTHFVRMDVADFYPSVSHKWMRSVLAAEVRSKSLRALCLQAILNETVADGHRPNGKSLGRGIPQGLAVSNALAELALMHVDAAMTTRTDVAYFRYVDDIVVLTKRRREQKTFEEVSALLRRAGVAAHPLNKPGSKSHGGKIRDGFEYLGYKFDWPRITVRPASVGKLEAALARSFTRYRYARDGVPRTTAKQWPDRCREKLKWHLDLIIAGCVFEGSRRGWLSYFSQIRHMQLLEHLDSLVIGLSRRFGLPSTATFKSFKKAYRFAATKRPDLTGYVPNLDKFTRAERESVLERIFFERRSVLSSLTDEQVEERFRQRVKRVVQEMERDIGAFS